LDYSKLPAFLRRYYGSPEQNSARKVGIDRDYDSGYFDIIRFYGSDRMNPARIEIKYIDGIFQFTDELIARYAGLIETELWKQGRLYDGPTVMMAEAFDIKANPPVMTVREARYGDVAGSGYALDLKHPLFESSGETLREYYKNTYPGHTLESNPLANCLGVCGYLLIREENESFLLQVRRSGRVASLENSPGPSVAGGVDFVRGYKNLNALLINSLQEEIAEELNLDRAEFEITPLAFAREIFRGERPQLFALVETSLSRNDIATRLDASSPAFEEIESYEFHTFPFEGAVRKDRLERLNHEARMNYYLLEEYLAVSEKRQS